MFLDRKTRGEVARVKIARCSVTRVLWNAKINQIFVACQDGAVRVLYDPQFSTNGALLCVNKKPKRKSLMDFSVFQTVRNPHALPMYVPERAPTAKRKKLRADPTASRKPVPPSEGEDRRRGTKSTLTAHLMKCMAKNPMAEQDPREALLAWDEKAKADPMFFGNAYGKTQPKPIFSREEPEEDDESEAVRRVREDVASAPQGADKAAQRKTWQKD